MEAKLSGQAITVAVVEDEPLLRDLLRVALQQHSGLEVVGVFSQAEQTLRHIPQLQPQVVLQPEEFSLGLGSSRKVTSAHPQRHTGERECRGQQTRGKTHEKACRMLVPLC